MHRHYKKIAAVLVAATCLVAPVSDGFAMDQAKHDDIKTLLELTGVLNHAQAINDIVLKRLVDAVKKANPDIPQSALDLVTKDLMDEAKRSTPEFEEALIDAYDEDFTDDDIKAILAFDRSPVGQKMLARQSFILSQMMAVGETWGQKVHQRVMARLRDDLQKQGYKL